MTNRPHVLEEQLVYHPLLTLSFCMGKAGMWPLPHCAGQDGRAMSHQSGDPDIMSSTAATDLFFEFQLFSANYWKIEQCTMHSGGIDLQLNEMVDEYRRKPSLMSSTQTHL